MLFVSDICWGSLTQRPQHIAARLSRRTRVLWIEPLTLGHPWRLRPVNAAPLLQILSVPQIPLNARAAWMRALARVLVAVGPLRILFEHVQAALVRRALRALGWGLQPSAAVVQNFQLIGLVHRLGVGRIVFDYIDDAFGFARLPPVVQRQWHQTIESAHRISVTSPRLHQLIEESVPGAGAKIVLVPNGVEFGRFAAAPAPPADLPPGPPVLCYVGSVYPWLDMELLGRIARTYPELRLVLIGRAHPEVAGALRALEKNPNFLYLGPRPYEEIPAYLHAVDAGIIPFQRNRLTEAVNPVKLYEYSAAGIPTISTAFSDDLQAFRDEILIGETAEEFLALVPVALRRRADRAFRDRLTTFARSNDWEARAQAIAELLEGVNARAGTSTGSQSP
jgi:glycosyltransferase involved in cell wall biosynthesis